VNGKDENSTHQANRTITASKCTSARRVRIASNHEFATHTADLESRPIIAQNVVAVSHKESVEGMIR
jgi:formyltetrahydrofolate hydrolase